MGCAANRRAGLRSVIESLETRCLLSGYTASLVAPVPARTNMNFNAASETMVRDPSTGMLFGFDTAGGAAGTGTVYEVNPTTKTLTVITTLQSTGPQVPLQLVIDSSGNLFGISLVSTASGGALEGGNGELFELPASNYATPMICYAFPADFSGSSTGAGPVDMFIDGSNNIDILTSYGGANNGGTVDQFQPGDNYQTPHLLGSMPQDYHVAQETLSVAANGDIFGADAVGGANQDGDFWELTPQESVATNIGSFTATTGPAASGSFYIDANNNVFGEAKFGVFEYTASNQQLSLIAPFVNGQGESPSGGLIADSSGNLYGDSVQGGSESEGSFFVVNGTTHAISYTTVSSSANGIEPFGAPVADGSGNFFLATTYGAANSAGAVIEVSPGSGTGGGGGGGTGSSSLTPAVLRSTLPASVVGGISKPGTVTVSITNGGSSASKGVGKVQLFASTDGSVDSSSVALGTPRNVLPLKAGRSESVLDPVNTESLPSGSYMILAEVTDSTGAVSDSTTGPSLSVAAPFVSLAATLGPVVPATVKLGGVGTFRLILTNAGNINATGPATIDIGLSTDGATVAVPLTPVRRAVTVLANGKPTPVVLTFRIAKTFSPGGTYEPIITYNQGSNTLTQTGGEFTIA
jgi:hypothetical protein